jgi:hypothetical protein
MRARWRNKSAGPTVYRIRAVHRPSPTLGFAVSLFVHLLLVLMLYRAYNGITGPALPTVQIVARAPSKRFDPEPAFVAVPTAEAVAADPIEQLAARDVPLPRAAAPLADAAIVSTRRLVRSPKRTTVAAVLPSVGVELPSVAEAPTLEPAARPAVAPAITPRERLDTLALSPSATIVDSAPRLASRPIYGPSERRPAGLAMLRVGEPNREQTRERRPAAAFALRGLNEQTSRESRAAIERGLEFLARVQLDDGRWRFDDLRGMVDPDAEPVNIRADVAATGLAVLAFLGAGHDQVDGRYHWTVDDALEYLIRTQQENCELFVDDGRPAGLVTRFYGHGIATLALVEAYGMTGDPRLVGPAQRALDYLARTQHPSMGGWRYSPGVNTDLSVTGWQLVALRSGQLAGLRVRPDTLSRISECLAMCRDSASRPGLYRYNPWASPTDPLTRHGRLPSTVMTSVGLLMELHLGREPADARLQAGADHLLANLPQVGDAPGGAPTGTLANPGRDSYYWYYGTQAMYYLGGDYWQAWAGALEPLLTQSQSRAGPLAGSWDPLQPVPDKWSTYGGRLYVTALNLLSLEINSRRLPLDCESVPQVAERTIE